MCMTLHITMLCSTESKNVGSISTMLLCFCLFLCVLSGFFFILLFFKILFGVFLVFLLFSYERKFWINCQICLITVNFLFDSVCSVDDSGTFCSVYNDRDVRWTRTNRGHCLPPHLHSGILWYSSSWNEF